MPMFGELLSPSSRWKFWPRDLAMQRERAQVFPSLGTKVLVLSNAQDADACVPLERPNKYDAAHREKLCVLDH